MSSTSSEQLKGKQKSGKETFSRPSLLSELSEPFLDHLVGDINTGYVNNLSLSPHRYCICACMLFLPELTCACICVNRQSGWLLPSAWSLQTKERRRHHHTGPLRYIPRRAVLYCPGNDERKLGKLALLDVDCAVLDCEDGVALSKKV